MTAPAKRLSERQGGILQDMGIAVWVRRDALAARAAADTGTVIMPDSMLNAPGAPCGTRDSEWESLRSEVAACTRCALHRTRTQTVFGVGNPAARWLVIGEAPGAEEDRQGEPFVGPAGLLLNEMLRAVGLDRGDVYIANILKCRPPENRDPRPEEVSSCADYLHRQMALVAPRLILAVGRIAAQNLLQQDVPVGRLRGRAHSYGEAGIPLVVTYHPAYLLRSPGQKRKSWDDLRLARSIVDPLQS